MKSKWRAAVIGVGHLGQHHARIYHEHPDVELAGVVDSDESQGKKIARKYSTQYFASVEPLLGAIDIANVVVPTAHHHAYAKLLLEHNVHVLVEKPFTRTVEEAQELVELQRSRNLILQVGHIERFNPAIAAMRGLVFDPVFIEVHRLCPYNPRGTDVGVVLDLMIHDIDIVLNLVGSAIREIKAVGVPVVSNNEDLAHARIEFANGAVANIAASKIGNKEMRKIRIFQPNAYLSLDYQNQAGELYTMEGTKICRSRIPLERGEPLKLEIDAFLRCVQDKKAPLVSAAQGKRALEVAFEIIRQIRKNNEERTAGKAVRPGVAAIPVGGRS